jgi:TetR/AcrR family transcriptional regulator, cholesterol catabolism regulator
MEAPRYPDRLLEIFETAVELFAEKGVEPTSMQDIADRVGMTKPGLYHYIKSKRDLLIKLIWYHVDRMEEQVRAELKKTNDPEERLRTLVRGFVEIVIVNRDVVWTLIYGRRALGEEYDAALEVRWQRLITYFQDLIGEMEGKYVIHRERISVATLGLIGACAWIHRWYAPEVGITARELADQFLDLFLFGLVEHPSK